MPYLGQMARSGSKEDSLAQLEAANLYTDSLTIPNSVIDHEGWGFMSTRLSKKGEGTDGF